MSFEGGLLFSVTWYSEAEEFFEAGRAEKGLVPPVGMPPFLATAVEDAIGSRAMPARFRCILTLTTLAEPSGGAVQILGGLLGDGGTVCICGDILFGLEGGACVCISRELKALSVFGTTKTSV
jgi:hypothetical protein